MYVLSRNVKNIRIVLSENFPFSGCKFFNVFELACFRYVNRDTAFPTRLYVSSAKTQTRMRMRRVFVGHCWQPEF